MKNANIVNIALFLITIDFELQMRIDCLLKEEKAISGSLKKVKN